MFGETDQIYQINIESIYICQFQSFYKTQQIKNHWIVFEAMAWKQGSEWVGKCAKERRQKK